MDKYVEKRISEKFEVMLPALNERQRRLYLASEARALGHGAVTAIARLAGVARDTVYSGLKELEFVGAIEGAAERSRQEGGGRKRAEDTQPGLTEALLALVDPETRGDPMSALRWTTKSTRHLVEALNAHGFKVGRQLVSEMLQGQGFSLQANVKTREGSNHEDRDAQFNYLNQQIAKFQARNQPVVSVDTKKKELVGDFKNSGREWQKKGKPEPVRVHDFQDKELGKAIPYGVYDIGRNEGWVNVGTDSDTSAFAVESIRRWWHSMGKSQYEGAVELLVTADGGGSNGSRNRLWKSELAKLSRETGLRITVCHLPPGTSKWNKIEHRLFSHITMNWRGRPLTSHEVIVQLIGATATRKGLKVNAALDTGHYPKGIKISDDEMDALPIHRHTFHGEWNYTISSRLSDKS